MIEASYDILPIIDVRIIYLVSTVGLLLCLFGFLKRAAGSLIRLFCLVVLLLALLNPVISKEKREPQPDIALILLWQWGGCVGGLTKLV